MSGRKTRQRGFTLIEVLTGLLILGFVMMTSLAVFYEHERRTRDAEEMILVWQAISNEAELIRFRPWDSLGSNGPEGFQSDLSILARLEDAKTMIEVSQANPAVKEIVLRVEWGAGKSASSTVIRSDTGGTNLW